MAHVRYFLDSSWEFLAAFSPRIWLLSLKRMCWSLLHLKKMQRGHGFFDLSLFDTLKQDKNKSAKEAQPGQDSTSAVIFASMALPRKREDLCTLFWLPLLTLPASPLMCKTVLEYHFDRFIPLFSATLIHVSVQSVGPNPLMNVFFLGFTWEHIPTPPEQPAAGWVQRMLSCIVRCSCLKSTIIARAHQELHVLDEAGKNGGKKRHRLKWKSIQTA